MSKIRYFSWGNYEYFEHCPFCGSVKVDFDHTYFRCPDCGAVVTFNLPSRELVCDGPSDEDKLVSLWNRRSGERITADDLCVMAQKAEKERLASFQYDAEREVWPYVINSAKLGKFSCEIPTKFLSNPGFYEERGFVIRKRGDTYLISWKKDIEWD